MVVGEGMAEISEEGNHQRVRRVQGGKSRGDTDRQRVKDWGVNGVSGKPEGTTLGSTTHRVERGGTRAGSQRTRAVKFLDTDIGQTVMERFGRG